jgi:hypothetical protein
MYLAGWEQQLPTFSRFQGYVLYYKLQVFLRFYNIYIDIFTYIPQISIWQTD